MFTKLSKKKTKKKRMKLRLLVSVWGAPEVRQWKCQICGINMITRKSSCVNARGIPPAAYQVLAMLGGTPSQVRGGTPSQVRGGTQSQVPHPRSGGDPVPNLGGTPSRPGQGGTLGTPTRPGMGYTPTVVNRQTFPSTNITFPHTTYAGGNN